MSETETKKKPRSLVSRLEDALFSGVLALVAPLARTRAGSVVQPFLSGVARAVRVYRRAPRRELRGEELGRAWQRLMPTPKIVPITQVEGDTAYGEIHVACPLRGTGDVEACHRLMAYDRALVRPMGARFVVLESQAEPGVTRCRVAMRPIDVPASDLVPAHVRARASRQPVDPPAARS